MSEKQQNKRLTELKLAYQAHLYELDRIEEESAAVIGLTDTQKENQIGWLVDYLNGNFSQKKLRQIFK